MSEDYVIIWEPPKQEPPEFRLYYDDKGHVVTYTCEKLEGNYIVIDALTFAQARPDVRVVDGRVSNIADVVVVARLEPNEHEGVLCSSEDVSIIVNETYDGDVTKWKLQVYELR